MKHLLSALALCVPLWVYAGSVTAKAYIVTDMDGNVLKSKNPDEVRAIASITKLVTTAKASFASGEELIEILPEDMKLGRMRNTPLKVGQEYTRAELTELALISSDNVAAMALGRTAPKTLGEELPQHTTIVEASGLDPHNRSTAREIADMARAMHNTSLAHTSVQPKTAVGERRNTNPLINKPGWTFYLSKTGFISDAGGCLVVIAQVSDRLLTFVLLGSRDTRQRWRDLYELRKQLDSTEFSAPEWAKQTKKRRKKR